ncbi:MAG: tRNA (guanine(46)-N(7))-methyltransferase TrmB [Deinococcales bacterium]
MPRYLHPNQFSYPQPLESLFGNTNPLHLEVGFGDGRFWAEQHKQDGNVNYLGVEVSGVSLQKAFARYKALHLENIVLTRISAEFLIRNALPEQSISRLYLNFPDPWFKEKHSANRFVRTETFELLSSRLCKAGELWLTTDHPPYMEYALEQAEASGLYKVLQTDPPAAALQTKYAMRWQSQGLGIHHARFQVKQVSEKNFTRIEIDQGETMPHSQLSGDIPQTPLKKVIAQFPDCTIILLENYTREGQQIILARVEEPDYAQEILIAVGKNPKGRVTAKLESFGQPLITSGVKKAVGVATAWLEAQGMTVVRRAY